MENELELLYTLGPQPITPTPEHIYIYMHDEALYSDILRYGTREVCTRQLGPGWVLRSVCQAIV